MVFLAIIFVVLISNYLILYWVLLLSPKKRSHNIPIESKEIFVSIIIPFRNEVENLPNLIHSLNKQKTSKKGFEVIFVDDHSTDKSLKIINELLNNSEIIYKTLTLNESFGKKSALEMGFKASSGEIIIQTDADVTFGPHWIDNHIESHISKTTLLVCGPVDLTNQKGLLHQLQKIEMMALMQSTFLTININKPVMCNGANLSFKRQILTDVIDSYQVIQSKSGDDVFLLHQINSKYGSHSITYLATIEGIVHTQTFDKINDLLEQRSRWAKKSKEYKNIFSIYLTTSIVLANISILLLQIISPLLTIEQFFLFTLTPFILKWLSDLLVIIDYKITFKVQFSLNIYFSSVILEILYPIYILLVGFRILFRKQIWKGRMIG